MQEVYNKTMAMLFRGTKNLANNNAGIEMEEAEEEAQSKDKVTNFKAYFSGSLSSVCSRSPTSSCP